MLIKMMSTGLAVKTMARRLGIRMVPFKVALLTPSQ